MEHVISNQINKRKEKKPSAYIQAKLTINEIEAMKRNEDKHLLISKLPLITSQQIGQKFILHKIAANQDAVVASACKAAAAAEQENNSSNHQQQYLMTPRQQEQCNDHNTNNQKHHQHHNYYKKTNNKRIKMGSYYKQQGMENGHDYGKNNINTSNSVNKNHDNRQKKSIEFPKEFIKYTLCKPSLQYCENPRVLLKNKRLLNDKEQLTTARIAEIVIPSTVISHNDDNSFFVNKNNTPSKNNNVNNGDGDRIILDNNPEVTMNLLSVEPPNEISNSGSIDDVDADILNTINTIDIFMKIKKNISTSGNCAMATSANVASQKNEYDLSGKMLKEFVTSPNTEEYVSNWEDDFSNSSNSKLLRNENKSKFGGKLQDGKTMMINNLLTEDQLFSLSKNLVAGNEKVQDEELFEQTMENEYEEFLKTMMVPQATVTGSTVSETDTLCTVISTVSPTSIAKTFDSKPSDCTKLDPDTVKSFTLPGMNTQTRQNSLDSISKINIKYDDFDIAPSLEYLEMEENEKKSVDSLNLNSINSVDVNRLKFHETLLNIRSKKRGSIQSTSSSSSNSDGSSAASDIDEDNSSSSENSSSSSSSSSTSDTSSIDVSSSSSSLSTSTSSGSSTNSSSTQSLVIKKLNKNKMYKKLKTKKKVKIFKKLLTSIKNKDYHYILMNLTEFNILEKIIQPYNIIPADIFGHINKFINLNERMDFMEHNKSYTNELLSTSLTANLGTSVTTSTNYSIGNSGEPFNLVSYEDSSSSQHHHQNKKINLLETSKRSLIKLQINSQSSRETTRMSYIPPSDDFDFTEKILLNKSAVTSDVVTSCMGRHKSRHTGDNDDIKKEREQIVKKKSSYGDESHDRHRHRGSTSSEHHNNHHQYRSSDHSDKYKNRPITKRSSKNAESLKSSSSGTVPRTGRSSSSSGNPSKTYKTSKDFYHESLNYNYPKGSGASRSKKLLLTNEEQQMPPFIGNYNNNNFDDSLSSWNSNSEQQTHMNNASIYLRNKNIYSNTNVSPNRISLDDRISNVLGDNYENSNMCSSSGQSTINSGIVQYDQYGQVLSTPQYTTDNTINWYNYNSSDTVEPQNNCNYYYKAQNFHHDHSYESNNYYNNNQNNGNSINNNTNLINLSSSNNQKNIQGTTFAVQKGNVLEIVPQSSTTSVISGNSGDYQSNLINKFHIKQEMDQFEGKQQQVHHPHSQQQHLHHHHNPHQHPQIKLEIPKLSPSTLLQIKQEKLERKLENKRKRKFERDKKRLEKIMRKEQLKLEIRECMSSSASSLIIDETQQDNEEVLLMNQEQEDEHQFEESVFIDENTKKAHNKQQNEQQQHDEDDDEEDDDDEKAFQQDDDPDAEDYDDTQHKLPYDDEEQYYAEQSTSSGYTPSLAAAKAVAIEKKTASAQKLVYSSDEDEEYIKEQFELNDDMIVIDITRKINEQLEKERLNECNSQSSSNDSTSNESTTIPEKGILRTTEPDINAPKRRVIFGDGVIPGEGSSPSDEENNVESDLKSMNSTNETNDKALDEETDYEEMEVEVDIDTDIYGNEDGNDNELYLIAHRKRLLKKNKKQMILEKNFEIKKEELEPPTNLQQQIIENVYIDQEFDLAPPPPPPLGSPPAHLQQPHLINKNDTHRVQEFILYDVDLLHSLLYARPISSDFVTAPIQALQYQQHYQQQQLQYQMQQQQSYATNELMRFHIQPIPSLPPPATIPINTSSHYISRSPSSSTVTSSSLNVNDQQYTGFQQQGHHPLQQHLTHQHPLHHLQQQSVIPNDNSPIVQFHNITSGVIGSVINTTSSSVTSPQFHQSIQHQHNYQSTTNNVNLSNLIIPQTLDQT